VMVDGELVWFLERGGRSLLNFHADPQTQRSAATALADLVASGRVPGILVEKLNGVPVLAASHTDTAESLLVAGFSRTPRGLRMR